jgi:hypothetical protein
MWYHITMVTVERVQSGVRMERRLLKVLKGLAEFLDVSLGDLLEGIVLHAFEQEPPFGDATVRVIERLKDVYGLDLRASDSHHLTEGDDRPAPADDPTPTKRARLTGTIEIALSPRLAFTLFTPSGERAWAHGWDPQFPSPGSDETEPGTVFLTDHGDKAFLTDHGDKVSIWTVFDCDPGKSIGYAVTTPGQRCGLVTVACRPSAGGTQATVSYDLTALKPGADAELDKFAAGYPSFLEHWEHAIAKATQREAVQRDG